MIRKGLSVVFVALGLTACGSTPNQVNQSEAIITSICQAPM